MSEWVDGALETLRDAMDGDAPPAEFLPPQPGQPPSWAPRPEVSGGRWPVRSARGPAPTAIEAAEGPGSSERVSVVVRTSGSTGTPKETLLSAEALRASADMTAQALGGHGQWLLTLHPSYVAGLAVLTRSLRAGTVPVPLLERSAEPTAFAAAAEQLTAERRYVSLVPTQLQRLLDSEDQRLLGAMRRFDAILLGGGRTSPELFGRAKRLGLNVLRTYGMAETCGGCVYDGAPLPGVGVELDAEGRVLLSGAQVALGYRDSELTAERFDSTPAGERRFRTDDLGEIRDGVLSITGRTDDVINTGGVKVSAVRIQQVLEEHPSVRDAFVASAEDPEWGQKVCAVVVLSQVSRSRSTLDELNAAVREQLGAPAVPKHYELLGALPQLRNGKPDRQALNRLLRAAAQPGRRKANSNG
ncbi:AMP-binding protein [Nesterenkonia populi]|uniref:AMP-binding protein n=1 Tax=Nesterenkonia populi TaxID=1591087 RepID=UPI0014791420|nr:AMP-binding protein [Nesterenkonia populi]